MGVGTHLERFAAFWNPRSSGEWSKSSYGDPFGAIFVPNWVGQGSGASSHTFFLVPGTLCGVSIQGTEKMSNRFRMNFHHPRIGQTIGVRKVFGCDLVSGLRSWAETCAAHTNFSKRIWWWWPFVLKNPYLQKLHPFFSFEKSHTYIHKHAGQIECSESGLYDTNNNVLQQLHLQHINIYHLKKIFIKCLR